MRPNFCVREILAAALLISGLALPGCGDDGTTAGPPSAPPEVAGGEPGPIQFVKGIRAGRDAAGSDDALIFVYVGRYHPT